MKKRGICQQSPKAAPKRCPAKRSYTIGIDLGDKTCRFWVLEEEGAMVDGRQRGDEQASDVGYFGHGHGAASRWRWERIHRGSAGG
jgi:hypothetical protein